MDFTDAIRYNTLMNYQDLTHMMEQHSPSETESTVLALIKHYHIDLFLCANYDSSIAITAAKHGYNKIGKMCLEKLKDFSEDNLYFLFRCGEQLELLDCALKLGVRHHELHAGYIFFHHQNIDRKYLEGIDIDAVAERFIYQSGGVEAFRFLVENYEVNNTLMQQWISDPSKRFMMHKGYFLDKIEIYERVNEKRQLNSRIESQLPSKITKI